MRTRIVGEINIDRVVEAERPHCLPSMLFPAVTEAMIDLHRHWLVPDFIDPQTNFIWFSWHSFVVRTPRICMVVDTCGGNDKPRPQLPRYGDYPFEYSYHMKRYPYLQRLMNAGVRPEEVTHVFCTHLHPDHVGWNTQLHDGRWVPTFPNAKYLFSQIEYDYWLARYEEEKSADNFPYIEDSVLPVIAANQAVLIGNDFSIDHGIVIEPAPGHTPGQACLRLVSGNQKAVLSADVLQHAVQVAYPELNSLTCADPVRASQIRRAFVERYVDTDTLILPAHFRTPTAGYLISAAEGFRYRFD